jgi:hypothetical protein
MLRDGTHSECLGGIMARVYDHEARLIGRNRGVMRSFADDQRVEGKRLRLEQRFG